MRFVHVAVVALFAAAIIIFALQNFQTMTVSFLGFTARAPVALVAIGIYLLGMATGSTLYAGLKRSIHAVRRQTPPQ